MAQGIAESVDRRARLQEAMRTAVDGETITNGDMMEIWGVTKGTWTDRRNRMSGFPTPITSGNVQIYPRVAALKAMWAEETRKDAQEGEKSRRLAALVGAEDYAGAMPSISDLTKANMLQQSLEQRLIQQGKLVPQASIQKVAGDLLQFFSTRFSSLGTVLDPNGLWPASIREAADKAGQDWLLRTYAALKDMLAPDVAPIPPSARANGSPPGRAGPNGASGPRRARVAKPARKPAAAKRGGNDRMGAP